MKRLYSILCLINLLIRAYSACSDGYYPIDQNKCAPCPDGHYCPKNQQPIECPTGSVSFSDIYKRVNCATCSDGYYQDQTGQSACKVCPPGHFCPSPDLALKCPKGTVSFSDIYKRVKCTGCSDGYYQKESGSGACNECPPGHFCPTPDLALQCPKGTVSFSDIYKRTECAQCSDGYYQDLTGQIYCKQCPVGHYCPNPDSSPIPCPIGTVSYSDVYKRTSCSKCSLAYYNDVEGQTACKSCPIGHFCPASNLKPIQCPVGTKSALDVSSRYTCIECSKGYFQDSEGQDTCKLCPAGKFCADTSKTPQPCPAGFYCKEGSFCPVGCNNGYTSPSGSTSSNQCYKVENNSDKNEYQCSFKSNSITQVYCQPGFKIENQTCKACDLGSYCQSQFQSQLCPAGSVNFNNENMRTTCLKCMSGYYQNKVGGKFGNDNQGIYYNDCKICPNGFSCSSPERTPDRCPLGYENSKKSLHKITCLRCPYGTYNLDLQSIDGTSSNCRNCPLGHSCSSPEKEPIKCPPGTTNYLDAHHRVDCRRCPYGTYNTKTGGIRNDTYSECLPCPIGYYCPNPNECPKKCPSGMSSHKQSTLIDSCFSCSTCNNSILLDAECLNNVNQGSTTTALATLPTTTLATTTNNSLCELEVLNFDRIKNGPIKINKNFNILAILESAEKCKINLYHTSSFRIYGEAVNNAIVEPAIKSNHFVGHAIDLNLYLSSGELCNSACMNQNQITEVNCFITDVQSKGLRWGGTFNVNDPVHFDDNFSNLNPNEWKIAFDRLQKNCR